MSLRKRINEFGLMAAALGFFFGHTASDFLTTLVEGAIMPVFDLLLEEDKWTTAQWSLGQYQIKWGQIVAQFVKLLILAPLIIFALRWLNRKELEEEESATKPVGHGQ